MDADQIKVSLEKAVALLFEHEPNLFEFTSETNQTEWNIAHHLANEVKALFPDYDCDVDVAKPNLNRQRPDIVVHQRGNHDSNFVVIEVKRDRDDAPADLEKIKGWWFPEPLRYQFGAVVVVNDYEDPLVTVIRNENL